MDYLFFKVFKNQYINNLIFQHLRIYANLYKYTRYRTFYSLNQDILSNPLYREYITFIRLDGNKIINNEEEDILPNNIEHLIFENEFDQAIPINWIPTSVKKLTFGNYFSHYLSKDILEPLINLKSLSIGNRYKHKITYLPPTLHHLELLSDHNKLKKELKGQQPSIDINDDVAEDCSIIEKGILPILLDTLILSNFKLEIDSIPKSVRILKFTNSFNQVIKKGVLQLDGNLKQLEFGKSFNQPLLENSIPPNLETLVIGDSFNQSLDISLLEKLNNLKTLIINSSYNIELPNLDIHLNKLEKLVITNSYANFKIPNSLIILMCNSGDFTINSNNSGGVGNLKEIHFLDRFNLKLSNLNNKIPNSVKFLSFGCTFNQVINNGDIPSSVTNIQFLGNFNKPITSTSLPPSIKSLTFTYWNQDLNYGDLPENLEELNLGEDFNKPLKINIFPITLKKLIFGKSFDYNKNLIMINENIFINNLNLTHISFTNSSCNNNSLLPILENSLPINISNLKLSKKYNHPILYENLKNLKRIKFGKLFNHNIIKLPNSIMCIKFGKYYNNNNNLISLLKSFSNNNNNNNLYKLCFQNLTKENQFINFVNYLPNSVKVIKISNGFIGNIESLPWHLNELILPIDYSISNINLNVIKNKNLNLCFTRYLF